MDQKQGYKILAAHAYPPMEAGMCGNPEDLEMFRNCADTGVCPGIDTALEKFKTLNSYIELFRGVLGICELSDIAEAYWLGSDTLKKAYTRNFLKLVDILEKNGTSKALIWWLRKKPPGFFVPHHNFQVLMSAKRSGDTEEGNLSRVNTCFISRGRVTQVIGHEVSVRRDIVTFENTYLKMAKKDVIIPSERIIPKSLKAGDTVTLHWGWICWKLSKGQEENLVQWTTKILENYGKI